jgi:hypothetical protein
MFPFVFRLLALAVALSGAASARGAVSIGRSVGSGRVTQIARTPVADLVIIDAGHESGLRQGMVCVASHEGRKVGELLLVDLRPAAASALIIDLQSGDGLHPGDLVTVKTVSSKK